LSASMSCGAAGSRPMIPIMPHILLDALLTRCRSGLLTVKAQAFLAQKSK
jgi:hypothetical protein